MRAAVFQGPGTKLAIEDRQTPVARPGDIVLRVAFCGICGSDLHATEPGSSVLESGTVLGHEFSGVVTESAASDVQPGDRVIGLPLQECDECRPSGHGCRDRLGILCPRNRIIGLAAAVPGAYAEYVRMPAHHALKIPGGLDLKDAALTEPLAVGAHAVRAAGTLLGVRVLVIGAGPIGLAVALLAQLAGAREVVVSEPANGRRAKAAAIGARVIDPSVEQPGSADVIFECVGIAGLLRQCIELAPVHGRIIVVGVCRGEDRIFPRVALRKELGIQFVLGYNREEFAMVLDLLAARRIHASPLITGVIGLDQAPDMFEALRTPGDHAKVLIDPSL